MDPFQGLGAWTTSVTPVSVTDAPAHSGVLYTQSAIVGERAVSLGRDYTAVMALGRLRRCNLFRGTPGRESSGMSGGLYGDTTWGASWTFGRFSKLEQGAEGSLSDVKGEHLLSRVGCSVIYVGHS